MLFPTVPRPVAAQAAPAADPGRELVVGTNEAPPFALRLPDGSWGGISIELWRHLAEQLHLRYRLVGYESVPALMAAATSGEVDAAVAALSVTAERRQVVDFTQPFYATGLGVAVTSGAAGWLPVLRTFLSNDFLKAVLALLGITVAVGLLIWLFERRDNPAYGGGPVRGMIAGLYWSAIAMTQAGAAQDGPKTLPGRMLGTIWMVASVVTVAVFIAGITSALTTQRIQGLVRNVQDLRALRVGAVQGTSAQEFLDGQRVSHRGVADLAAGLRAVAAGRLDAFVHDKPLLTYVVRREASGVQVLGLSLDPQNYAMVLPRDSALRPPLDVALLATLRSEWWQQTLFRYLGQSDNDGAAR
jgi:polar amino acid transport system substrate-binding protein